MAIGAELTSVAVAAGSAWVTKLLNKQPANVSAYFSGNGEYAANVARQKKNFNDAFAKYAGQLSEGSPEANEFLAICKPSLDWMGQRNAPVTATATINSEGQRLVDQFQAKSIVGKTADVLNSAIDQDTLTKIIDPIKNFFSFFSLQKDKPEQAYLGTPKTDTVIPILIQQEPAKEITQEIAAKEGTAFEKFALPVGIAVVSGVVLFMMTRG